MRHPTEANNKGEKRESVGMDCDENEHSYLSLLFQIPFDEMVESRSMPIPISITGSGSHPCIYRSAIYPSMSFIFTPTSLYISISYFSMVEIQIFLYSYFYLIEIYIHIHIHIHI